MWRRYAKVKGGHAIEVDPDRGIILIIDDSGDHGIVDIKGPMTLHRHDSSGDSSRKGAPCSSFRVPLVDGKATICGVEEFVILRDHFGIPFEPPKWEGGKERPDPFIGQKFILPEECEVLSVSPRGITYREGETLIERFATRGSPLLERLSREAALKAR